LNRKILILDLDGVLITTPPWKTDEIEFDGYSKFNSQCVNNLNELLGEVNFDIWLSSSRRKVKSLKEFNTIFSNRHIHNPIAGFLPIFEEYKTRRAEIEQFISEFEISDFLILDDDKSLNELTTAHKDRLVLTELMKGFTSEKLKESKEKL